MYTLATRARFFEAGRMIRHITGFRFLKLMTENGQTKGVLINELQKNRISYIPASAVIIASGGLNGLFGNATGSVLNTGNVNDNHVRDDLHEAN